MLAILRQANATRQKEWDLTDSISIEYRGNELAGEVGEACNVIKKIARERLGIRGTRASKADLVAELIDLSYAVETKFNETSRKYNLNTVI